MAIGRARLALLLGLAALVMAGCAASANDAVGSGTQSGFWLGLWHGAISPITFVVSLLRDDIAIYEVHNSGHWYDLGFIVGACVAYSGAARSHRASTPRDR